MVLVAGMGQSINFFLLPRLPSEVGQHQAYLTRDNPHKGGGAAAADTEESGKQGAAPGQDQQDGQVRLVETAIGHELGAHFRVRACA